MISRTEQTLIAAVRYEPSGRIGSIHRGLLSSMSYCVRIPYYLDLKELEVITYTILVTENAKYIKVYDYIKDEIEFEELMQPGNRKDVTTLTERGEGHVLVSKRPNQQREWESQEEFPKDKETITVPG
jgi:hypothetical protein